MRYLISFLLAFQVFNLSLAQNQWVDSVYNALSKEQRIAQLFMVAAYSNRNEVHYKAIDELVEQHGIGGLIFFQGGPYRELELTNRYQSKANVPLFVAIDGEWGLAMRLDSTISFPRQMTLGAIQNNELIYDMGVEIAKHCKRIGIQINFAPVVDVNVNPKNPVIGDRSFGEDKYNVTAKARAYMKGMQSQHVLANAKHFPGHGDTDKDSHVALPVINHDMDRLKEIELYPFQELFKDSLASIMVAHLQVPALDSTPNTATTLSKNVVTGLLKEEMGFQGLIFTDALNMKGVSAYYKPGEVDLKAFLAGNDVLLYAEDVPTAINKIKSALDQGQVTEADLEARVKKILSAKYWSGLHDLKPLDKRNLTKDLNSDEANALNNRLFKEALTVVQNETLPLSIDREQSIASISIGSYRKTDFQKYLDFYADIEDYHLHNNSSYYDAVINKVKDKDVVIIGIHDMSRYASRKFGINYRMRALVDELSKTSKVVLCVFGSPYSLKYFEDVPNLICAYENNEHTHQLVPQLIFGSIGASGKLPVSATNRIKAGMGVVLSPQDRLGFGFAHDNQMKLSTLESVDTLIQNAIKNEATPGAQVLVARKGEVVYYKNYGHLTYDKKMSVGNSTTYDLASITKVAVSTQIIMKMYEEGVIQLDSGIVTYLPELKGTNKANMTLREILSHQSGLKPWIPFWKDFADERNQLDSDFFFKTADSNSNQVANGLYCSKEVVDSLYSWLIRSELLEKKEGKYPYRYSDLGYYLIQKIVERHYEEPLDILAENMFFKPMGVNLLYHPLLYKDKDLIAPTENDEAFRKQQIKGYVHDPGAAMMNCVAGHAGLFGDAFALAQLAQMNLNNGEYGGKRYFKEETIKLFTSQQFDENRRGLGWDRMQLEGRGGTSEFSSPSCFGHSGFTGTCVWIDPTYDLIYVFLSNRVYPDASNAKLIKSDVRTRIHDLIYLSILEQDDSNFLTK